MKKQEKQHTVNLKKANNRPDSDMTQMLASADR